MHFGLFCFRAFKEQISSIRPHQVQEEAVIPVKQYKDYEELMFRYNTKNEYSTPKPQKTSISERQNAQATDFI